MALVREVNPLDGLTTAHGPHLEDHLLDALQTSQNGRAAAWVQ
jgi:hypothetical protein